MAHTYLGRIVVLTFDGRPYGGGGDLVWIAPVCTIMSSAAQTPRRKLRVGKAADVAAMLKVSERTLFRELRAARSRDNLPNPRMNSLDAYVPSNMPAIDDLFSMLQFSAPQ